MSLVLWFRAQAVVSRLPWKGLRHDVTPLASLPRFRGRLSREPNERLPLILDFIPLSSPFVLSSPLISPQLSHPYKYLRPQQENTLPYYHSLLGRQKGHKHSYSGAAKHHSPGRVSIPPPKGQKLLLVHKIGRIAGKKTGHRGDADRAPIELDSKKLQLRTL